MGQKHRRTYQYVLWGTGLLVALAIAGMTVRGIIHQITRLRQIQSIEAELQAQIQYEQERRQSLQETLRRISSPEFLEEWARVYGGMVRPGEIRLVLPAQGEPTPATP